MLAIRGKYDGKTFKALPNEKLPAINHEVSVAIIFLEDFAAKQARSAYLLEIAKRMRAERAKMLPLNMSIKELIEAGRER